MEIWLAGILMFQNGHDTGLGGQEYLCVSIVNNTGTGGQEIRCSGFLKYRRVGLLPEASYDTDGLSGIMLFSAVV